MTLTPYIILSFDFWVDHTLKPFDLNFDKFGWLINK